MESWALVLLPAHTIRELPPPAFPQDACTEGSTLLSGSSLQPGALPGQYLYFFPLNDADAIAQLIYLFTEGFQIRSRLISLQVKAVWA